MEVILTVAMVAVGALLAIGALYVLATRFRDERALHDLAVECQRLRINHAKKISRLGGGFLDNYDDVEIVEEAA